MLLRRAIDADPRDFMVSSGATYTILLGNSRTTKAGGSYFRVMRRPPASVRLVGCSGLADPGARAGERSPSSIKPSWPLPPADLARCDGLIL